MELSRDGHGGEGKSPNPTTSQKPEHIYVALYIRFEHEIQTQLKKTKNTDPVGSHIDFGNPHRAHDNCEASQYSHHGQPASCGYHHIFPFPWSKQRAVRIKMGS